MLSRPLLFLCLSGAHISNNPHESMEPRCVLPSLHVISVPADCTRPLSGVGRNRYLRLVPGSGATAGNRVLCNMAFRFRHDYHTFHVSIQDRKSYCFSNVKHGPDAMDQSRPNGMPSRRTIRCGGFLCAWLDFRDATMPRKIANPAFRRQLINPARKVCLSKSGLTVMCRNVCAAPMGWVLRPGPVFGNPYDNDAPTNQRRSARWVHIFPSGAGTAVTSPTSMPGGTELRLFLSSDLSGSRPTNRQLSRRITMRRSEVIRFVGDLRGAFRRSIPLRPFLSTHQPNTYMNLPGAWVTRPGFRGRLPH